MFELISFQEPSLENIFINKKYPRKQANNFSVNNQRHFEFEEPVK